MNTGETRHFFSPSMRALLVFIGALFLVWLGTLQIRDVGPDHQAATWRLVRILATFAGFIAFFFLHYSFIDQLQMGTKPWFRILMLLFLFLIPAGLFVIGAYQSQGDPIVLALLALAACLVLIYIGVHFWQIPNTRLHRRFTWYNVFLPLIPLLAFGLASAQYQKLGPALVSALVAGLILAILTPKTKRPEDSISVAPLLAFYVLLSLEFCDPGVMTGTALVILFIWLISLLIPGILMDMLLPVLSPVLGLLFPLFIFPRHRRLKGYWWPTYLPPLKSRSRKGVTLIELLIEIAIISILVAGIAGVTGVTFRSQRRQADWQAAVSLAEDEIALLRSDKTLPEPGRYPVNQQLHGKYSFSGHAVTEIRPGPDDRLREIQVRVHIGPEGHDRDVNLAVLLPVTGGGQ